MVEIHVADKYFGRALSELNRAGLSVRRGWVDGIILGAEDQLTARRALQMALIPFAIRPASGRMPKQLVTK